VVDDSRIAQGMLQIQAWRLQRARRIHLRTGPRGKSHTTRSRTGPADGDVEALGRTQFNPYVDREVVFHQRMRHRSGFSRYMPFRSIEPTLHGLAIHALDFIPRLDFIDAAEVFRHIHTPVHDAYLQRESLAAILAIPAPIRGRRIDARVPHVHCSGEQLELCFRLEQGQRLAQTGLGLLVALIQLRLRRKRIQIEMRRLQLSIHLIEIFAKFFR
jgi:hypothetical protein